MEQVRFLGKVIKNGRYYEVSVPDLGVYTQGTSIKDAHEMAIDALEIIVDKPDFKAELLPIDKTTFEISGSNSKYLIALFFRQLRINAKLSLSEFAQKLGAKSRNEYAKYEQGKAVPGLSKVAEIANVIERTIEIGRVWRTRKQKKTTQLSHHA
ncbi:MAG: type II toxin-antitoxin system HicB family antitoxin [Deltaproteobacteria bacterium]|nr:type II toxin-antitoxin system HicB family antitoxin [Deltaproteobacteria bacterium]